MFFKFPYTDMYNLNLDWMIKYLQETKANLEQWQEIIDGLGQVVHSVNGQTGDVQLGTLVNSVNGQTGAVQLGTLVNSVNGKTGAVEIDNDDINALDIEVVLQSTDAAETFTPAVVRPLFSSGIRFIIINDKEFYSISEDGSKTLFDPFKDKNIITAQNHAPTQQEAETYYNQGIRFVQSTVSDVKRMWALEKIGSNILTYDLNETNGANIFNEIDASESIEDYSQPTLQEIYKSGQRILFQDTANGIRKFYALLGNEVDGYTGYIEYDPVNYFDTQFIPSLQNEIRTLNNTLNDVITGNDFDFSLGPTWEQGGVNYQGEYTSWARIRTDYIDVEGIGELNITPASGYAFMVVVYTENKTYTKTTAWTTVTQTINIDSNEKYIRLCLRTEPEANLSPSAGVNVSVTAVYKLPSNVASLTTAVNTMQPVTIDNFLIWSIGGIANGENTNVTNRIKTDFFNVSDYSVIDVICQTGYKFSVALYNASKEWLFSVPITGFSTDKKRIVLGDQTKYIRMCMATTDDATQSDTSISANISCLCYKKLVGDTLENSGKEIEISDDVSWVRGTLDDNGNYTESTSRVVTEDFIQIVNYQSIRILPLSNTVKYNIIWFGTNGRLGSTNISYGKITFNVPANATRMKIILYAEPETWMGTSNISNGIKIYAGRNSNETNDGNVSIRDYFVSTCVDKTAIPNLVSGTTILTIGDSITAAQDETGWVYHIAQMTGVSVIDKAIGGSTFGESVSDQTHRINNQIATVTSEEWASANLVIVAAGTNDYQHETPLDELKEKVQAAVTAIKAKTNVPIVFITPIRRGFEKNNDIIQKIAMISGIIANVALANQCNVICGYDFPIPTYNINGLIDNMTRDTLHPTAIGANVYARAIINALK